MATVGIKGLITNLHDIWSVAVAGGCSSSKWVQDWDEVGSVRPAKPHVDVHSDCHQPAGSATRTPTGRQWW